MTSPLEPQQAPTALQYTVELLTRPSKTYLDYGVAVIVVTIVFTLGANSAWYLVALVSAPLADPLARRLRRWAGLPDREKL